MRSYRDFKTGRNVSDPSVVVDHLSDVRYGAVRPQFPNPPDNIDWTYNVAKWPMYKNDTLSCCTTAGIGHLIQAWSCYHDGQGYIPTDDDVVGFYGDITGYDSEHPYRDTGASMVQVLEKWKTDGMRVDMFAQPDKPVAYVKLDPKNMLEIRTALYLFGPLYVGAALPKTALEVETDTWYAPHAFSEALDPDVEPGSGGRHCMLLAAAHDRGDKLTFITWGQKQHAECGWWTRYVDEVYAVLHDLWIDDVTMTSNLGYNATELYRSILNIAQSF